MSTKIEEAARRLGEALEKRGWQVFEESKICPRCRTHTKEHFHHCPYCGDVLQVDVDEVKRIESELKDSLVEALYP